MNRSFLKKSLLLLTGLLVIILLAACSPNPPDISELAEDEALVTVTSSSAAETAETTKTESSETEAESEQTTEPATETTTAATEETTAETTAETTESTTKTTTARPTVIPTPTAAPTPTPEPTPVPRTVSLAIKCHIATEAGLTGAPANGIILEAVTVDLGEDETVFDILDRVSKDEGIVVASRGSGASAFVTNIAGITAVDAKSGWVYSVNGEFANIGSGAYKLSPGDVIEWHYTMDTGNDL